MAIKFSSEFFSLKLLIFRLVKTYFSAPDHTIFVKKIRGSMPPPQFGGVLSHALLHSFIVFKYVLLILRKDKYILGRIGLYFWGFGEKLNYF